MHRSDKKLKLNVLESSECERDARFQERLIFLQIFFLLSLPFQIRQKLANIPRLLALGRVSFFGQVLKGHAI